jgi:uncharacterized membrane protein YhaH (DUF805 family)
MSIPGILFSFNGRIGRGGFWLTVVVSMVLSIAALLVASMLFGELYSLVDVNGQPLPLDPPPAPDQIGDVIMNPAAWIAYLIGVVPAMWVSLAGSVKRLHDRGKSGWWYLLMFVLSFVIVGFFWWLIELGFLEGDEGDNRFGPPPHGARTVPA